MRKAKALRCIPLMLVFALLLTMLPLAASAVSSGDFSYTVLEDGTAEISGYTGSGGNVEIPAAIDGYSVSSIGEDAFSGCTSLASIDIPNSVTSISDSAFVECSSLASITIPDSVISIGDWAFSGCTSLASITIPDSVTSIGYSAFYGCSSLVSITMPDSVISIGYLAFSGCTALAAINVAEENENYSSVDGVLFNKVITELITYPQGKGQTYVIPDSVTFIGIYAFESCTSLTSVTIPQSVTDIGYCAFYDCTSLKSITIPDGVTSIDANAFSGCTGLQA